MAARAWPVPGQAAVLTGAMPQTKKEKCMRIALTAIIFPFCCFFFSNAIAKDTNPCVSVYTNAVQRIDYSEDESVLFSYVRKNACSSSNRSITAGFDSSTNALVNGIPLVNSLMGRLGATSNKQFCDASEKMNYEWGTKSSLLIEPLNGATANFNQCLRIWASGQGEITHEVGNPGLVAISIRIPDQNRIFEIQGVSGDFECTVPNRSILGVLPDTKLHQTSSLVLRSSETITCKRGPKSFPRGGYRYPRGTILVGTSAGITYNIQINDDEIFGPATKRESDAEIEKLRAEALRQKNENTAILRSMDEVRIESHVLYFGKHDVLMHRSHGRRYDCSWWYGENGRNWKRDIPLQLCPNAASHQFKQIWSHSGDRCGYHYYMLSCIYFPVHNQIEKSP